MGNEGYGGITGTFLECIRFLARALQHVPFHFFSKCDRHHVHPNRI